MPSESILEQAKLGQLKIISLLLNLTKLTTPPHLSGTKKDTQEQEGNWKWKMDVGQENSTDCGGILCQRQDAFDSG